MGAGRVSGAVAANGGLFSGFWSIAPISAVLGEVGMSEGLVCGSIDSATVRGELEISDSNCDRLLSGSLLPNAGNSRPRALGV